jgi:hypothetical protein
MIYNNQQQAIDSIEDLGYYRTETFMSSYHPDNQEIPIMAHNDRNLCVAIMPDGTSCTFKWVIGKEFHQAMSEARARAIALNSELPKI